MRTAASLSASLPGLQHPGGASRSAAQRWPAAGFNGAAAGGGAFGRGRVFFMFPDEAPVYEQRIKPDT